MSDAQYEPFKAAFEAHVRQTLKPEQQEPSITYDIEIEPQLLDLKTFRLLQRFQPFGPDNAEPIFLLRAVRLSELQCVGAEGQHLRGKLGHLPFIAFKMGQQLDLAKESGVDVLVTLGMNHFNDRASLQLQLKDLMPID